MKNILFPAFITVILISSLVGCSSPENESNSVFHVPEGFTIEPAVDPELISFPMFANFDDQGRLYLFEATEPNDMSTDSMVANPTYHIRMLTDTDQDGIFDQSVIYADEIPFPMGGIFYNGSVYAAAPPDLLKFTDTDGDGVADKKEVVLTGWTLYNNGAILSGPYLGPDGWLYLTDARRGFDITTLEGERLTGKGTRIWRCLPDGSQLEWVSGGGFDNAIEIDFMPGGDPIGTMTYFRDPANGQRDALMHWVYGGVYPKYNAVIDEDQLKLTGDLMPVVTKMPRVAPSGIVRFRGDHWGEAWEGEWFSAIFNTGQVLQHSIETVGASYQSTEEVFLSSDLPDFHPTDVLQDGNGDLLVIVTGGWFIKGCPLSRVAKPNVPGGIYRIKKTGSQKWNDPWGASYAYHEMTISELSDLLEDERPRVRENALNALESKGAEVVSAFTERFHKGNDDDRLEMVYALHRLRLPAGDAVVRKGLRDSNEDIRIAAARLCGLARDHEAFSDLLDLVRNDASMRVRRQAATALGQIGNKKAVPGLLEASAGVDDRFLLHAIRYALLTLQDADPVVQALAHSDPAVQMTALVVLDQMDDSPLSSEHVRPFLESSDPELQETGIWVLRHHPEWAGIVTDYVKSSISQGNLEEEKINEFEDLMVSFCGNATVQQFIHQAINDPSTSDDMRISFLRVMGKCSGRVPVEWISSLGDLLTTSSEAVKSTVLGVIETRQIKDLEKQLNQLLSGKSPQPETYLKVLNVRLMSTPDLSKDEFEMIRTYLNPAHSVAVRRSAQQVLDRANLSSQQLEELAGSVLIESDEVTFAGLVHLFDKDSSEQAGLSFIHALQEKEQYLNLLSEQELTGILQNYPESVRQSAASVMEILRQQNAERHDQLHSLEEGLVKGDIGRGRDLFFGKAICSTCHTVGDEGDSFGPDLTTIGAIRSRHDLLEAIVFPSVSFAREYETYVVQTATQTYTGVLKEGLESGVVVIEQAPGLVVRIPEDEIVSMEQSEVSLMPAGLDQSLSNQELSDLIAFLEALPYTVDRLIELSTQ